MTPVALLYVHGSADLYGSDRVLLDLIASLDRDQFEPIVVVPARGPLVPALEEIDVEVHVRPLSVLHRSLSPRYWMRFFGSLPGSIKTLRQLIRQRGVQLVHTNTSHVYDGALAARAAGVAHIWHVREVHTGLSAIGDPLSRLIYACSDLVIVVSDAVKDAFFDKHADGVGKIGIVYDGVDLDEFSPTNDGSAFRAELGLASPTPLVGVVGRIAHWKGQLLFLKAAALARERVPNAHFVIVGDAVTPGDHRLKQELIELVDQREMKDAVTFTGVRSDVPQIMAALNVLVLPSEMPEPWGMVVLEAMATARPVVATRQGGPLESVEDGATGYLVPPDDPRPMAEAIVSLLQAPERGRAMGARGRSRCELYFDQRRTHEEIQRLYEQVIKSRYGWADR